MSETVKLRIERGTAESVVGVVVTVVSFAVLYYSVHPTTAEEHLDTIRHWRDTIIHRITVNQTLASIRALPETKERR